MKWASPNWENLEIQGVKGEYHILIINSDEEIKQYLSGDYPTIDFSKKPLLLAYGYDSACKPVEENFRKVSEDSYMMNVCLQRSIVAVTSRWRDAIVVDKLSGESRVEVTVTEYIEMETESRLPQKGMDMPFTTYLLEGFYDGGGKTYEPVHVRDLLIIDNDEEMREHVTGNYLPIDFSKKTLLLFYDYSPYEIVSDNTITFQKVSEPDYVMTIPMVRSISSPPGGFEYSLSQKAVLIDKLGDGSQVELKRDESAL